MKLELTAEEKALHVNAIEVCRHYIDSEWTVIQVLQKVESAKLYRKFGVTSLHQYAVKYLNLSDPTAYLLIAVARKCTEVPALGVAIKHHSLTAPKAARIVSTLTRNNSAELIAFAEKNSVRAIDFEVARRNPKARTRESVKPISEDFVEIKVAVPRHLYEKIKRSQSLVAQKQARHADITSTIEVVFGEYLKRNDPVERAQRAVGKRQRKNDAYLHSDGLKPADVKNQQLCNTEFTAKTSSPARTTTKNRKPLSAAEKHEVFARDGGRCTFVDSQGHRCANDKWLQIHHIQPVSQGGSNNAKNLTTLCWSHHDLTHQLTLPIEGQVTWLREPVRRYG